MTLVMQAQEAMPFVRDDGGRSDAGFLGEAGDCVARAIAIASGVPYKEVYAALAGLAAGRGKKRSARNGVHKKDYKRYLEGTLGFEWVPTMGVGTGCRVRLAKGDLPCGRLVVRVSKHLCAVVDGVVRDTYDPSRGGTRCVYGYWRAPQRGVDEVNKLVDKA